MLVNMLVGIANDSNIQNIPKLVGQHFWHIFSFPNMTNKCLRPMLAQLLSHFAAVLTYFSKLMLIHFWDDLLSGDFHLPFKNKVDYCFAEKHSKLDYLQTSISSYNIDSPILDDATPFRFSSILK